VSDRNVHLLTGQLVLGSSFLLCQWLRKSLAYRQRCRRPSLHLHKQTKQNSLQLLCVMSGFLIHSIFSPIQNNAHVYFSELEPNSHAKSVPLPFHHLTFDRSRSRSRSLSRSFSPIRP
jgi:hypothetical protein